MDRDIEEAHANSAQPVSSNRRRVVVQKYGGSSVASVDKLREVARLVVDKKNEGYSVVVVVSAMGDTTDELLEKARAVSRQPDRRELDMLLSVGERISMSLLAMAIRELGEQAVSLTGSQSGIITTASHANARIMEVRPFRIEDEIDAGRIVIVAGYQGVSYKREVTTLGRGGSDTTAVALAAALDAEACEIYSDVPGVFSADPRIVPNASKLASIGYEEMQEMAAAGAKVLNAAAVEFAKQARIALYAKKTGSGQSGTVVRRDVPMPTSGVRGIAHERAIGLIQGDADIEAAGQLLDVLDEHGVHPKHVSVGHGVSCVVGLDDLHNAEAVEAACCRILGGGCFTTDLGAVSLIGEGITRDLAVTRRAQAALRGRIRGLSTSRFRITLLVESDAVEDAVRTLHDAFDLAHPQAEAVIV